MTSSPLGNTILPEIRNASPTREVVKIRGTHPADHEARKNPAAPTRSELLRAALEHARRDTPVFPCKPGEKGPCWARGVLEKGHLNATTDQQKITAWWNRWPNANLGMPTGKPSGIVVVDLDVHKDGAWTLEELEENLGPLGDYMLVRSGSGGLQLWYLRPEGELRNGIPENVLGPGVCIKGDGGYVVVAPSVTAGPYEALSGSPGPCPAWLEEALRDTRGEIVPKGIGHASGTTKGVKGGGTPATVGRNVALASICGGLHDGKRDLARLTADLATERDRRWPEFPDAEVAKIARSIHKTEPCRPRAKRAPEKVQRALAAFEEGLGAMAWPGHSSNRLSLLKTYVLLARKHGRPHEDGVALSVSNSQAALHNGCSARSVRRNNQKLVEAGLIRADNEDRAPTEAGTIVLGARRDNPPMPGCVLTHNHHGFVVEEGLEKPEASGVGGLGHFGAVAKLSATRARHGKPLYASSERIGFLSRMGKRAEFAVDVLEDAQGCRLLPRELAGAMGITKVGNMTREGGWLSKLMDAGVVERDDEGYLALTDGWLAAWDRRRVEDEEEMDRERDRERYRRLSAAWAERVAEHAEDLHQKRLDRMAFVCHDGGVPADGLIGELEPVEDVAVAPVEAPEAPEAFVDAGDALAGQEESGDLSELAMALGRYLDLNPGRSNESPSWLGIALWAEGYTDGKPDEASVGCAMGELDRASRMGAAA